MMKKINKEYKLSDEKGDTVYLSYEILTVSLEK